MTLRPAFFAMAVALVCACGGSPPCVTDAISCVPNDGGEDPCPPGTGSCEANACGMGSLYLCQIKR
jgi:hypothetical protein